LAKQSSQLTNANRINGRTLNPFPVPSPASCDFSFSFWDLKCAAAMGCFLIQTGERKDLLAVAGAGSAGWNYGTAELVFG